MTALIIIATVLLLTVMLLSIRVRFVIKYDNDGLVTYAKALFFKLYLTGEPEKELHLKDFKIKRFRKKRDKAIKKYNKSLLKKKKKSDVKNSKESTQQDNKKKRFSSPSELIDTVKGLLEGVLIRFPKYLHIDIKRFVIEVGGADAHQTAMLYGGTVQSMQYLITALGKAARLKKVKNAQVGVTPNFLCRAFRAEAEITAHISIFGLLRLGIKFISNYFKTKSRSKSSVLKERTAK